MPDRVADLARRARGPVGDVALTVFAVVFAVVVLVAGGRAGDPGSWGLAALVAALGGAAALAHRQPMAAVALACPVLAGVGLLDVDDTTDLASDGAVLAVFVLCFRVGARAPARWGLPAVLLLAAGSDLAIWDVDPSPFMVTVGAWAAGVVVAARTRAQCELESRGRELALERERYAAEAMRYERARIARELHDIVAHCLSAVVVQAGAGDYVVAGDPTRTATVFDEILGSVREAEDEIGRLVAVLAGPGASADGAPGGDSGDSGAVPAERVATLVRRARAAGLSIAYRLTGDPDRLGAELWDGVYRVIREAVTNALKHAPGAPIEIEVRLGPDVGVGVAAGVGVGVAAGVGVGVGVGVAAGVGVGVEVRNGCPRGGRAELASTGGGYGLPGMRERVEAGGGQLDAGPVTGGGWLVVATWPAPALDVPV